jgi:predicted enzyme related to lactoylglutathione lyase
MDMAPGYPMATFDGANGGGWLIQAEGYTSGSMGIILYFDCNSDLQGVLDRVEASGGTIEVPKTEIASYGWWAAIKDSEGNLIGLHSDA